MAKKPLRLTNLGDLVRMYSVQTAPDFWREQFKEANRIMERDGDWEQMLDERIAGLQELRDNLRLHGSSWFLLTKEDTP